MHDTIPTPRFRMPKHQTTADPSFGPGDEYLIAARVRNYKLYRPSSIMRMIGHLPHAQDSPISCARAPPGPMGE